MSLALVLSKTMRHRQSGLVILILCGLILLGLPNLEALEEGDSCTVKANLPGICKASSKCEPHLEKYIKSGTLTGNDVPSCGLGTHEEIVCCPLAECCPGLRQIISTTTTKTTTTTTSTTTTARTTTTTNVSKLDEDSHYFDFQEILNGQKNQRPPQGQVSFNGNQENPLRGLPEQPEQPPKPVFRTFDGFQSMGPLGTAPTTVREPKIINRPQSMRLQQRPRQRPMPGQDSVNLIQQVNDRLRQQGMNIQPAKEVTTFWTQTTTTARPTRPTTTTTPIPTIANFDSDPWAPFRFRPSTVDELDTNDLGHGVAEAFRDETSTSRTIQVTPTTRVDITSPKDRPAVRACRQIEERQNINSLSPHILDGIPVEDGTYPHMAAIAFSNFGSFSYRCGGSLISTRHVLTAAHCVNSVEDTPVHVRLGTVNIQDVNDHYQDIAIIGNVTIHPEYVSSSKYNDIAILELAEEAKLSYFTYPACLETNIVDPPANSKLFVAGWGVMNQTTRRTSKVLLRAPLTIVPVDQCDLSFAELPSSKRFLKDGIINTLLCAADSRQQKDACQGDSGGPLVMERDIVNNKYSILGVISSGFGCATKTPGLYTRVASYLDFIESVVWPDNVV